MRLTGKPPGGSDHTGLRTQVISQLSALFWSQTKNGLRRTHSPTTKTKDILVTAENADAGDSTNMATDPVCLAIIDEDATTPTSTYRDENYYFCCNYCKRQFDENPRRYSRISHDISVDLGSMK